MSELHIKDLELFPKGYESSKENFISDVICKTKLASKSFLSSIKIKT